MTEEQITNENNEAEISENNESTIKKHRSPNYPFIGLEAAIERAGALQKIAGVHPIRVTTAWETWEYKKGAGNQIVAALDAYGLIEVEGIADRRQIKLTTEARKILSNHSETPKLLKDSALKPDLHREIWEHFDGALPPNDRVVREYLEFDRNFNPNYVDKFIEQFRATLAFANVTESDKIDNEKVSVINKISEGGKSEMSQETEVIKRNLALPEGRIFKASIEVLANGTLDVIFAGSMNGTTVSLLKDIYDIKEKYEPKLQPQIQTKPNAVNIITTPPLLESGDEDSFDLYKLPVQKSIAESADDDS